MKQDILFCVPLARGESSGHWGSWGTRGRQVSVLLWSASQRRPGRRWRSSLPASEGRLLCLKMHQWWGRGRERERVSVSFRNVARGDKINQPKNVGGNSKLLSKFYVDPLCPPPKKPWECNRNVCTKEICDYSFKSTWQVSTYILYVCGKHTK